MTLLFDRYLRAVEEGRDIAAELLAEAGEARADLEARIDIEEQLKSLTSPSTSPREAPRIGRFHVLGLLGQGGIGRVHLAFDPKLGREIALKVLDHAVLLDKEEGKWILNEARSLARTSHRGVVEVYEVGEHEGVSYVAMEYVPGPSLAALIQEWKCRREGREGSPDPVVRAMATRLEPHSARLECLARLAEALAHCHDNSILHRDVKPLNVLFDADGWPKLIDFGLAHVDGADESSSLGLTRHLLGTAANIAPEQIASEQTGSDPRSDQFSFATLAYECLALLNPFQRKSRRATLTAVEEAAPPPLRNLAPAAPPDLAIVLGKAHQPSPADRYPSMAALARDLRAILEHRPISIVEPPLSHLMWLWMRRHRRGLIVGGATALTAAIAFVFLWAWIVLRERKELLAELGRIHPEEFHSLVDLEATATPLLDLRQRAAEFDAGFLNGALSGDLSGPVAATIDGWSMALARQYRAAETLTREMNVPLQVGAYQRLFLQESLLCPDCPYNLDSRRSSHVRFPRELIEGRQCSLDVLTEVRGVPASHLVHAFRPTELIELLIAGTYRLQVWSEGAQWVEMESVFYVPPGRWPEQAIELHPPRRELSSRAVHVARGDKAYDSASGSRSLRVPAFRIQPSLVSNADFRTFVEATSFEAEEFDPGDGLASDAVHVYYDSALAYARWAGGRLPLLAELQRAVDTGAFPLPEDTPRIFGEYVLAFWPGDPLTPAAAHYGQALRNLGLAWHRMFMQTSGARLGFRLVFSADTPESYREQANEPLAAQEGG